MGAIGIRCVALSHGSLRSVGGWKPYNEKGEPFGSPPPRDPAIIRVMARVFPAPMTGISTEVAARRYTRILSR